MEEWREIPGFESYAVSNLGRVLNIETDRIMALTKNQQDIVKVNLMQDGRLSTRSVALMVANQFLPDPVEPSDTPIHLDGDRTNCGADNLVWRPRWYAINYHRQFEHVTPYRMHVPIENLCTGERFRGTLEASIYYGILEHDIAKSVLKLLPAVPILNDAFGLLGE